MLCLSLSSLYWVKKTSIFTLGTLTIMTVCDNICTLFLSLSLSLSLLLQISSVKAQGGKVPSICQEDNQYLLFFLSLSLSLHRLCTSPFHSLILFLSLSHSFINLIIYIFPLTAYLWMFFVLVLNRKNERSKRK